MKRIMGLDLSGSLGYSVFEIVNMQEILITTGVGVTRKESAGRDIRISLDDIRRGQELAGLIHAVIVGYDIGGVVAEIPGGSQAASSAKILGMAKGLISAIPMYLPEVSLECVLPGDVKKALAGNAKASKKAIWEAARKRYPYYTDWPKNSRGTLKVEGWLEHVADSIGCVVHAMQTSSNMVKALNEKRYERGEALL